MPAYMDQDPKNTQIIGVTLAPAAAQTSASDINGTGVDFSGGDGLVYATIHLGVIHTDTVGAIRYEESSDDVTYTAVAESTATAFTGTSDNSAVFSVAFQRTKRYVRAVTLLLGATKSAFISISLAEYKKSY